MPHTSHREDAAPALSARRLNSTSTKIPYEVLMSALAEAQAGQQRAEDEAAQLRSELGVMKERAQADQAVRPALLKQVGERVCRWCCEHIACAVNSLHTQRDLDMPCGTRCENVGHKSDTSARTLSC
jgi:hypothetical protein